LLAGVSAAEAKQGPVRNEKFDLTSSAKRTLQIAATAVHRSVSEFVLESARARSEETLPDRQLWSRCRTMGSF
jgi:uncharacterized protein (DUF1778 family)